MPKPGKLDNIIKTGIVLKRQLKKIRERKRSSIERKRSRSVKRDGIGGKDRVLDKLLKLKCDKLIGESNISDSIQKLEQIAEKFLKTEPEDVEQFRIYYDSYIGELYPVDDRVILQGFENLRATTCYIDSLLVSMFGYWNGYDGMLSKRKLRTNTGNELKIYLRFIINNLRKGNLIDKRKVKVLRRKMYDCGWQRDDIENQQDVCELYMFMTEILELPFLPLDVTIFHGGKQETSDEKVVTQRMMELPVTIDNDSSQEGQQQEAAGPASSASSTENSDESKDEVYMQDLVERYFLDNMVEQIERQTESDCKAKIRTNGWSFLEILPYYVAESELGIRTAATRDEYPDERLVFPVMLKRYKSDDYGNIQRVNSKVAAPLCIDITRLVKQLTEPEPKYRNSDEYNVRTTNTTSVSNTNVEINKVETPKQSQKLSANKDRNDRDNDSKCESILEKESREYTYNKESDNLDHSQNSATSDITSKTKKPSTYSYRLVLRSVVCHKGDSANSGHYISYNLRLKNYCNSPNCLCTEYTNGNPEKTCLRTVDEAQATATEVQECADGDGSNGATLPLFLKSVLNPNSALSPNFSNGDHPETSTRLNSDYVTLSELRTFGEHDAAINISKDGGVTNGCTIKNNTGDGGGPASSAIFEHIPQTLHPELIRFDDLGAKNDRISSCSTIDTDFDLARFYHFFNDISSNGYLFFYHLQTIDTSDNSIDIPDTQYIESLSSNSDLSSFLHFSCNVSYPDDYLQYSMFRALMLDLLSDLCLAPPGSIRTFSERIPPSLSLTLSSIFNSLSLQSTFKLLLKNTSCTRALYLTKER